MTTMTTDKLTDIVDNYMSVAFYGLFQEYIFFGIAVLLAVVPIMLFIFVRLRHRAYVYKDTTPMKFHMLLIFLIPFSAVENLCVVYGRPSDFSGTGLEQPIEIAFSVILILIAVFVAVNLYRCKVSGPVGSVLYIWLFAAFKNYRGIALGFLQIPKILDGAGSIYATLSSPEQVMAYSVSDYYITLAMTINFFALAVTALLGAYYYHRRYIFLPNRIDRFPKCSYCGRLILKGDCNCRNCGRAVNINPMTNPVGTVLDVDCACGNCGTLLYGGVCYACELRGKKRTRSEQRSELLKTTGKMILIMLLVYVIYYFVIDGPRMLSQRYILVTDMPEYCQKFSDQYNRLTKDLTLIGDTVWQNEFYTACETLYTCDSRWASCNTRTLRSNDWVFYGSFGKASFEQMKLLEKIREQVELLIADFNRTNAVSEERTAEFWTVMNSLIVQFSETVDQQENAQAHYELYAYDYNPLERAKYDFFDGLRFYMQYINTKIVAAVLLIIAFLSAIYVLNFFSVKNVLKSETRYMVYRSKSEKRLKLVAPQYAKVSEENNIILRSALILISSLSHIIRIINELWMLMVTIVSGIAVFLSLFRYRNIQRVFRWAHSEMRKGRESKSVSRSSFSVYKRQISKTQKKTIFLILFFLLVIHAWTITHPTKIDPVEEFMDLSGSVYWDNGPQINAYLIMINNARTIESDAAHELLLLIDDELARIQTLQEMQGDELYEKINKSYPEYWIGVYSLSDSEKRYLEDFRDKIIAGNIPAAAAIEQYANLGMKDFAWVYDIYHSYVEDAINDELNDLADYIE